MASTKIRGITIEIGADTNPLVKAFKNANSNIYATQKSLKDVEKLLKVDPSNVTLLAQKQQYLNEVIAETRQSLKLQEEMLKELPSDSTGKLTEEQMALARNIEDTKNKLAGYEGQLNDVNGEIMGTTNSTGKLEKATQDAGNEAEKAGNGGWTVFKQIIADLGTSVIKSAIAGMQKLGSALVSVGKDAVNSYADYEQLVGGVETIFGKASATVINNASKAYMSAGLSANEYMETVTAFSASLMQSAKSSKDAAKIADMAMIDMADNANKMGSSMESIQNAYQGFAKQNYTMLDNLKLGYGGTKSEMERLLKDATKISGVKYDIKNLSDVYKAIHVIQGELGITGTTAEEAANTIQGSMSAFQASWQNVLTALADENQDMDAIFDQFFVAVDNLWANLEPRISVVLSKMGDFIVKALNKAVPTIITDIVPLITNNLPVILETVTMAIQAVVAMLPEVTTAVGDLLPDIISTLAAGLPEIISAGVDMVISLASGIIDALPLLIDQLPTIIKSIVKTLIANLPKILELGGKLIISLIDGFLKMLGELEIAVGKIFIKIWDGLKSLPGKMLSLGKDMIQGIIDGVNNMLHKAVDAVKNIGSSMLGGIKSLLGIHSPSTVFRDQIGKNLALGIEEGFTSEMTDVAKDMQNAIPTNFNLNGQELTNGTTPTATSLVVNMNIYESENAQATANAVVNRLNAQLITEGMVWR